MPMPDWTRRLRWADVGLIAVGLGAMLRVWNWAHGHSLWLDEEMIARNVRDRGFLGLAADLDYNQSAPLGWLWTQWLVMRVLGTGERELRLVPLLFALGTLVVAWLIGRRWLGPVGTVTLVGWCAVQPFVLRYAIQVKQYSADTMLVLALVGLAGWAVEDLRSRRLVVWWVAAAAASWFSTAAIIVTPGLAIVLYTVLWRRYGLGAAVRQTPAAFGWLASFLVHYVLALRYTI